MMFPGFPSQNGDTVKLTLVDGHVVTGTIKSQNTDHVHLISDEGEALVTKAHVMLTEAAPKKK